MEGGAMMIRTGATSRELRDWGKMGAGQEGGDVMGLSELGRGMTVRGEARYWTRKVGGETGKDMDLGVGCRASR